MLAQDATTLVEDGKRVMVQPPEPLAIEALERNNRGSVLPRRILLGRSSGRPYNVRLKKPSIYLDTNIVSALHYDGTDINAMARRMATRDWWESERRGFELFASIITEQELAEGSYGNQQECLRFVRRLKYLPMIVEVRRTASLFLNERLVPTEKPGDAAQLAMAVGHEMDYLLTWNYAHLANPATQARGEALAAKHGFRMPWLVSPDSIPRASLGQTIRRTKT